MNDLLVEALRQMVEGDDFTAPATLLADLTAEQATTATGGNSDSIASIVWHTLFWVEAWNAAAGGGTDRLAWIPNDETWPAVTAEDWQPLRDRFISALSISLRLAATVSPDAPGQRPGRAAVQNLLQIAVHTSYHIGQILLIRRQSGLWPPTDGE